MHLPSDLPVFEILPQLRQVLNLHPSAVLVAPTGAGKTTALPLALLEESWAADGRIVLVEPRRIVARAAARRLAGHCGETPGQTVGYAIRLETNSSSRTRILVVTEGVFIRMALDDPELAGIAAVFFDEFHERSLDADFGLALALDIQEGLRPDLKLMTMSATLDAAPVARLMGHAPIVESRGRAFPVEIVYRPRKQGEAIERAMAGAVRRALHDYSGSLLAFLPGRAEIERCFGLLAGEVAADVDIMRLHGGLDGGEQDAAIRPADPGRRKVVLATSLAESSITIDGVRVVVDSGLSRLPKFDPASGLTHLETVRVSRASADQRAGRAGRTEPGVAIRLWHERQTAALPAENPPAMLDADLSGLVLDCAAFGVGDPRKLRFLDPPPDAALNEARKLLRSLGALDVSDALTDKGRLMRKLPLPARLSNMVVCAARFGEALQAAELALLVTERGMGGNSVDLDRRLANFRGDRSRRARQASALARRIAELAGTAREPAGLSPGRLLADAFADRIAVARGKTGNYRLANGRGATLDETDSLARQPYLVVADLQGRAQNARITAATSITVEEISDALGNRIESRVITAFDQQSGSLRRRERRQFGAIVLGERSLPPPAGHAADRALIDAIREHGLDLLPWSRETRALLARIRWLRNAFGEPWPELSQDVLSRRLEEWLLPYLTGAPDLAAITPGTLAHAVRSLVPAEQQRDLDRMAPAEYLVPTGRRVPIEYREEGPVVSVRVQELYGLQKHPAIADGRVPLLLELLSPAGRPIQATRDLPGFWQGSWKDVRREMRGRYPKHVWPEHPHLAEPTTRAKRR